MPKASDDENNVVAMTRVRNSDIIPDDDGRILLSLAALAVLIGGNVTTLDI